MSDELNPGIRKVVEWLSVAGFETCDSGDGRTHDYKCDRDHPYVVMRVRMPALLAATADVLFSALQSVGVEVGELDEAGKIVSIQASYDPGNKLAFIDLVNLDDEKLTAALASDKARARDVEVPAHARPGEPEKGGA